MGQPCALCAGAPKAYGLNFLNDLDFSAVGVCREHTLFKYPSVFNKKKSYAFGRDPLASKCREELREEEKAGKNTVCGERN